MQVFLTDEYNITKEKNENFEIYIIEIKNKDIYHHLVNVLRVKKEDKITVVTKDKKQIIGRIENINKKIINIKGEELEKSISNNNENNLKYKYILFQGIPKSKKLELIAEKTTEIGVDKIIPVEMTRSIVRKKDLKENKQERLKTILKSASEQSKRVDIPILESPKTFDEIINLLDLNNNENCLNIEKYILVFYENKDTTNLRLKEVLNEIKTKYKDVTNNNLAIEIYILIGPEGGITEEEINKIKKIKNAKVVSLGKNILRTETAPIAALSIIKYELENI